MGLAEGPQSLLDQGRVGQHPAVQGGVVDLQAALQEQLLDVTIAERVAQVPRDRLQDQGCFVVATLEGRPSTGASASRQGRSGASATSGSEVLMPPACSTRGKRQNFATAPFPQTAQKRGAPTGPSSARGKNWGKKRRDAACPGGRGSLRPG